MEDCDAIQVECKCTRSNSSHLVSERTRRQHYRIYGRHNDQSPATRFLASAGNNSSKVPETATENGVELEGSDVDESMSLDGDSECTTFYKNVDVAASNEVVDGESEMDEHQSWPDELNNQDYEGQEDEWHSETQSNDEFELQRLKALSSIIALSQRLILSYYTISSVDRDSSLFFLEIPLEYQ